MVGGIADRMNVDLEARLQGGCDLARHLRVAS